MHRVNWRQPGLILTYGDGVCGYCMGQVHNYTSYNIIWQMIDRFGHDTSNIMNINNLGMWDQSGPADTHAVLFNDPANRTIKPGLSIDEVFYTQND